MLLILQFKVTISSSSTLLILQFKVTVSNSLILLIYRLKSLLLVV